MKIVNFKEAYSKYELNELNSDELAISIKEGVELVEHVAELATLVKGFERISVKDKHRLDDPTEPIDVLIEEFGDEEDINYNLIVKKGFELALKMLVTTPECLTDEIIKNYLTPSEVIESKIFTSAEKLSKGEADQFIDDLSGVEGLTGEAVSWLLTELFKQPAYKTLTKLIDKYSINNDKVYQLYVDILTGCMLIEFVDDKTITLEQVAYKTEPVLLNVSLLLLCKNLYTDKLLCIFKEIKENSDRFKELLDFFYNKVKEQNIEMSNENKALLEENYKSILNLVTPNEEKEDTTVETTEVVKTKEEAAVEVAKPETKEEAKEEPEAEASVTPEVKEEDAVDKVIDSSIDELNKLYEEASSSISKEIESLKNETEKVVSSSGGGYSDDGSFLKTAGYVVGGVALAAAIGYLGYKAWESWNSHSEIDSIETYGIGI